MPLRSVLSANFAVRAAALLCGVGLSGGADPVARPESEASKTAETGESVEGNIVHVHYLSETPYRWEGTAGNPLEAAARSLSSLWGQQDSETTGDRLENIQRQITWFGLRDAAINGHPFRSGTAGMTRQRQVFVIHGYEFCEAQQEARLDPLLVAARDGKPAMAEFVLLCRTGEHADEGRKFHFSSLRDKEILVDRGNCAELVYRWLDMQTFPETGFRAGQAASLRTPASAAEAVLSVYFREVEACIVTRESFEEVARHNPASLKSKLQVVRSSEPFIQYAAATSAASFNSPALRRHYMESANGRLLPMGGGRWTLMPAKAEYFTALHTLTRDWMLKFKPAARPAVPPAVVPAAPAARRGNTSPVARDVTAAGERRKP
jgi:hypothetical protein